MSVHRGRFNGVPQGAVVGGVDRWSDSFRRRRPRRNRCPLGRGRGARRRGRGRRSGRSAARCDSRGPLRGDGEARGTRPCRQGKAPRRDGFPPPDAPRRILPRCPARRSAGRSGGDPRFATRGRRRRSRGLTSGDCGAPSPRLALPAVHRDRRGAFVQSHRLQSRDRLGNRSLHARLQSLRRGRPRRDTGRR